MTMALSDEIIVGKDKITISIPMGYCSFDRANPVDSQYLTLFEDVNRGKNTIVLYFADCEQLKALRRGDLASLSDYGYAMSPNSLVNKRINMGVSNYLALMSEEHDKNPDKVMKDSMAIVEKAIEKYFSRIEIGAKDMGIFAQDEKAFYVGVTQQVPTVREGTKYMIGIWATSLVKRKAINFYLWKEYTSERAFFDIAGLTKLWVDETHSNN